MRPPARAWLPNAALLLALTATPGCTDQSAVTAPAGTLAPGTTRSLLIVTIDTLRADHVGANGYGPPTTPNLDRLAQQGAVFTQAIASCPWTRPSMASVMTGLHPTSTGITCVNFRVPKAECDVLGSAHVTLAELLRERGFTTAGIVANVNVDELFGFDQGFDSYRLVTEDLAAEDPDWRQGSALLSQTTTRVTAEAVDWLSERDPDSAPFLLYLHYLDPHDPYEPPAEHGRPFAPEQYSERPGDPSELARYDGEIRHVDASFARVLETLRARGLADQTGIVIFADHGEEFGEHGATRHGFTVYDEQLRVPLIMALPGLATAGRRIDAQVSLLDLSPTVLDAVGVAVPDWMVGRSLLPWLAGNEPPPEQAVLAERGYNPLVAWRQPPWKLIHDTDTGGSQLFHLDTDPGELQDVADRHPTVVSELLAAMRAEQLVAETMHARFASSDTGEIELSPEKQEQLEALGYVEPQPDAAASNGH